MFVGVSRPSGFGWLKRPTWRLLSCGASCLTGCIALRQIMACARVGRGFGTQQGARAQRRGSVQCLGKERLRAPEVATPLHQGVSADIRALVWAFWRRQRRVGGVVRPSCAIRAAGQSRNALRTSWAHLRFERLCVCCRGLRSAWCGVGRGG